MRRKIIRENMGLAKPGQDITVAGFAGLAGALILAQGYREELEKYFSPSYVEEICGLQIYNPKIEQISRNLEQWKQFGVTEWEAAGRGGILTALWNLAGIHDVGIEFTLRQIPVKQSTVEICEYFNLNPYRLFSEGCFLLVSDNGSQLAERLGEEGMPAVRIGRIQAGKQMEIIMEEGRGCLERPQPDELEKVIPGYFPGQEDMPGLHIK
ncbi:MAG TPA: AIR synthase [Candidatus Lachnoclostridium stercoravium]|uniref:AIR synthase n=1 Tax=Candidatus Lachnoclostridium stercoravium TaxID=2838633 RepID=A0A9D2HHW2_9FIRM|nr:AIR synthase [Candidatus Lachnoclostridium stercoravium]